MNCWTRPVRTACVQILIAFGICIAVATGVAAGTNPYRNLSDAPFASVTGGPQGAIVVFEPTDGAVSAASVRTAVASQHSPASLQQAHLTVERMKHHGLLSRGAQVRFPRTMVHMHDGQMALPDLHTAMVTGQQLGAAGNQIAFEFEGFSTQDEAALRAYLNTAVPKARMVYGPPAFDITVKVIRDESMQDIQGGTYNVTTNEIRIPPLSGNFPEDTYVLLMLVLNAFHDDAILFYDAWEQGFIGAAAYAIQSSPGVAPGYDPIDPGPFYCLSVYEAENQPELANSTYYPASGATNMLVWRIAMARAAWLKCYIEDERFFANFNRAYYDSFSEQLPGNVPALTELAASVLPRVEGQSFHDWFNGQYVLDTSVHLGPKLYTWNIPLETSVALISELYTTLPGGDETPMGAQARTVYWSYDFSVKLYAEEGNIMDIPASGGFAGEGFLLPTFFNIGGPQRVTVEIEAANLSRRYPYPYMQRGFGSGDNNLYGGIIGAVEGTLHVTGGRGISDLEVKRGVLGGRLTTGDLKPMQVEISFQTKQGQTTTRTCNVGWDSYVAFLSGAEQTRIQHTFLKGLTGLRMISLPVSPVTGSAPEILGIPADRLLMADWDPTLEGADKYTVWPRARPFAPGRGFWVKLHEDTTMQAFGVLPSSAQSSRVYLPLGWNIIGSPRVKAVNVADMKVQFEQESSVSFAEAVENGWLQQGVFGYEAEAGYDTVEQLQPFAGYWVRVLRSPGVYLEFPPVGDETASTSASSRDGLDWRLPLMVTAGPLVSSAAYLGVSPLASDRPDSRFDLLAPPDFGPSVKLRFIKPGQSQAGAAYLTDVRRPGSRLQWDLQAVCSLPDTKVRLSWPDLSQLPPSLRPVLVDRDTGRRMHMRTVSTYSFSTGPTGGVRSLSIELVDAGTDQLLLTSVTTMQASQGVVVSYSLSRPAAVTARVLNIAGRQVATVSTDQMQSAGSAQAIWNMRNSSGSLVPNGTYLMQVTARSDDGQQASAMQAVVLQR